MKICLVAFIICLPSLALADAVSYEPIFSTPVFKGGIQCPSISATDNSTGPATVYVEPHIVDRDKRSLQISCVQGGGDCDCYLLFQDTAKASESDSFYNVKDINGNDVWVLAKKDTEKSIYRLATETKDGEIEFRQPITPIFTDRTLTKTLTAHQLLEVPERVRKLNPVLNTDQNVLFTVKETKMIKGSLVSRLSVDWITVDPDDQRYNDAYTVRKSQRRFHLRDVWIRTFDDAGRINFWLAQPPGC